MRLVLRGPDNETREVELTRARVHVGRAYDNTIVLAENTVSRHHCSFHLDDQDRAILEDHESRYGTLIAGAAARGPTPVTPGQAITVGEWTIEVRDDKAGDATDTTLDAVSSDEGSEESDSQGPTRKTRLLDDTDSAPTSTSSGYLALLLTLAALGAILLAYVVVSAAGG